MANLYVISSILLSSFFLISAFFQPRESHDLSHLDWFQYVPLYVGAAIVNLMNLVEFVSHQQIDNIATFIQSAGLAMLQNVVRHGGFLEFLSMDMRKKIVRGKIGCFLVFMSMIYQISTATQFQKYPEKKLKKEVDPANKYGMAILVGIGYGLFCITLMFDVSSHRHSFMLQQLGNHDDVSFYLIG